MASLDAVVDQLKIQNKITLDLRKSLAGKSSADSLQALEDKSEVLPGSAAMQNFEAGQKVGEKFDLGFLMNPMILLKPLLVAAAGVAAAFAGLRGWEVKVLKNIDTIGDVLKTAFTPITNIANKLTTSFTSFVDDLTRGTLARFGIDPETGKMARGAKGQFTGKEVKTTAQMIQESMQALKTRAFGFFGLGPAGGLADDALKAADGTPSAISRVTAAFGKIMTPFRAIYSGVENFITGPGAKLFGFLDGVLGITKIGSAAGGLVKVLGKVLWPIGIIMSLFDGVEAWRSENGSQYDKITAGIAATVGDFIGAPLDLLKGLLSWVLSKFGFDETAKAIQDFSFEEKITNLINGIFDFPAKAIEWVKTLFTDPSAALGELWTKLVGEGGIIDILFAPARLAIDWITKTLGFREEDAPTFSFGALIQEGIDGVVGMFRKAFAALPSFQDIKNAIVNALPAFMVPDSFKSDEMRIQERKDEIDEHRAQIAEGDNRFGPGNLYSREKRIAALQAEIQDLQPVLQVGGGLTADEIAAGVRERRAQVVNVYNNMNATGGGGNGGGTAMILPATPTLDLMDPVAQ